MILILCTYKDASEDSIMDLFKLIGRRKDSSAFYLEYTFKLGNDKIDDRKDML